MIPQSTIAHARELGNRHADDRLWVTRAGDPGEVEYDEAGEPINAPDVPRVTVLDVLGRVTDDHSEISKGTEGPVLDADAVMRLDPGKLTVEDEHAVKSTDVRIEVFYGPKDRRVMRRASVSRVEHGQTVTRVFLRFLDVARAT